MTGHITEIVILGIFVSGVILGVLELLWEVWEGRKSAASNRSE